MSQVVHHYALLITKCWFWRDNSKKLEDRVVFFQGGKYPFFQSLIGRKLSTRPEQIITFGWVRKDRFYSHLCLKNG